MVRGYDLMRAVRASGLTATQRHVLNAFALRCDDEGDCWASMVLLARDTGLSERTVRTTIRSLEALRILVASPDAGRSTTWRIMATAIEPEAVAAPVPRQSTTPNRKQLPPTPAIHDTEPEAVAAKPEPVAPDLTHKDQPIDQPIDQPVHPRPKRSRKKAPVFAGPESLDEQAVAAHYATLFNGDQPTKTEWEGIRKHMPTKGSAAIIAYLTGLVVHPDAGWWRDKGLVQTATVWREKHFEGLFRQVTREVITTQVRARASPSRWTDGLRSLMETTEQPQIIEVTEVLHGR